MSCKTVAKSLADGIVQLVIPSVLIHKDNQFNDSVTVNISVFIEQRNISFQNDISLKKHEIGSPVMRKVKNHELGPDWELKSNAVADLFVMIIAWANQKA